MTAIETLNPRRLGLLARNELAIRTRSVLVAVGAVFGVLLIVNVASVASAEQWAFHDVFYPLVLMIGGHVITSLSFRELHDRERSYTFVTLPASQVEKYLSKLLLTTVGYVAISLVVYFLFSLLAAGLTTLLFDMAHPVFNPFDPLVWDFVGLYLATHGVMFFGAVYFRRLNLLNTILWINIIGIGLAFVTGLLARIVFWEYFQGAFWISIDPETFTLTDATNTESLFALFRTLQMMVEVGFLYVSPLFFWILGYFRLRETEVTHGI